VCGFEFEHLGADKVGATHTDDDNRLCLHRASGGQLVDIITVPSRSIAFPGRASSPGHPPVSVVERSDAWGSPVPFD
jgi:hypothetical protein